MLNKILFVLGVVVTISAMGSALTCIKCGYISGQQCVNTTVNCSSGFCYTTNYTTAAGVVTFARSCANTDPNDKECPDAKATCERRTKAFGLKSCGAACCTTDNCNNYAPSGFPSSSASGVMATEFMLCLMVIAGFLFA